MLDSINAKRAMVGTTQKEISDEPPHTEKGEGPDIRVKVRFKKKDRQFNSFSEIIDVLGAWNIYVEGLTDVGYTGIRQWKARDSIPAKHWDAIITTAKIRGVPLNYSDLIRLAQRKKK